jgi:hypothetical protein
MRLVAACPLTRNKVIAEQIAKDKDGFGAVYQRVKSITNYQLDNRYSAMSVVSGLLRRVSENNAQLHHRLNAALMANGELTATRVVNRIWSNQSA